MFVYVLFEKLQPGSRERVHLGGLDAKHLRRVIISMYARYGRLTLGELEALASLGTTGLLTFNDARVAGHEAFDAECVLVLGVDLDEGAGDGETESLGLTFVTATVKVDLDVILLGCFESAEGLLHDILKDGRGEVNIERTFVDGDLTVSFFNDHASYGCFTAANCIN